MNLTNEQIARVCHEANRAYCAVIGDATQEAWETAPHWQRDSAIAGVAAVRENLALTSEGTHEAWCGHKRTEGWRYGPVKDADAKTHPCLVPYGELPTEQRVKDDLFRAVVQALQAGGE